MASRSVSGRNATRVATRRAVSDPTPTAAQRRAASRWAVKNGLPRPLEMVQADLKRAEKAYATVYERGIKPVHARLEALRKELAVHPETVPPLDPKTFTLAPQATAYGKDEREVGDVLQGLINHIATIQNVVTLAICSSGDPNSSEEGTADVLRAHVENPLCDVLDDLRDVLKHARFRGSRLVVAKPEDGAS